MAKYALGKEPGLRDTSKTDKVESFSVKRMGDEHGLESLASYARLQPQALDAVWFLFLVFASCQSDQLVTPAEWMTI